MEIYCDESGFTGNQLLDPEQVVFAYSALAITESDAAALIQDIRKKHRLSAVELKGSALLKQQRGRHAIEHILRELEGRFKVVVHLKPYALAAKLFEYIFEPTFSACNSIFYGINFHRFVSTLLFVFFRSQDKDAVKFLEDFTQFARKGDTAALTAMFPPKLGVEIHSNPIHAIGLFAELHRKEIADEVLGFRESGVPNWLLDLTSTSVHQLLVSWGLIYDALEVTCDEAKPLSGDKPLFDAMIGRAEKTTINFGGTEHHILFNLSRPIAFEESHNVAGLQLADMVASASSLAWKSAYQGEDSQGAKRWRELLSNGLSDNSIWPDLSDADIRTEQGFAHAVVLNELVDRSLRGESLCDGMLDVYLKARRVYPQFLMSRS